MKQQRFIIAAVSKQFNLMRRNLFGFGALTPTPLNDVSTPKSVHTLKYRTVFVWLREWLPHAPPPPKIQNNLFCRKGFHVYASYLVFILFGDAVSSVDVNLHCKNIFFVWYVTVRAWNFLLLIPTVKMWNTPPPPPKYSRQRQYFPVRTEVTAAVCKKYRSEWKAVVFATRFGKN
jgi:hypothetical protein